MFQFSGLTSRTLSPNGRSLKYVVGLHDHKLADSDVNLIQQIEDYNRKRLLKDQTVSGVLTYNPLVFPTPSLTTVAGVTTANGVLSFNVPAFDVLMNGEVVIVGGNNSADLTTNVVTIPAPSFYAIGSSLPSAAIYVAFIEFWYQDLSVINATGYAINQSTGAFSFYPLGCVNGAPANYIPNDTVDPFVSGTSSVAAAVTTERVQIQWAIRVQPVDLSYDFTSLDYGLDPGPVSTEQVFAQAGQSSLSLFNYAKLGPINGDTGLWRAGDGNNQNTLGTMDGYAYAMPLAVVFQRNAGPFLVDQNPFGCADADTPVSGTFITGVSGRYDSHFADVVYSEDVVDTRSTISLASIDENTTLKRGFVDIISGNNPRAIGRGVPPGNLSQALGSLLSYFIAVSQSPITNTDTVGAFDGFMNGFSTADSTFYSTQAVSVDQKSVGLLGMPWVQGDAVTIALPTTSGANIATCRVQGLVDDTLNSTRTPVLFLGGQISITGIGTQSVTVVFADDLSGTSYDPGMNPLYLTIGVDYPVGSGMDLRHSPSSVHGGTLIDGTSGKTLPLFGVSEYAVSTPIPALTAVSALAYNPEFSNTIFGTRVVISVNPSTGVQSTDTSGDPLITFTVNRTDLTNNLNGIYVISATDQSNNVLPIASRSVVGETFTVEFAGTLPNVVSVLMTVLCTDTAQLAYNAPVKGVSSIEETVLAGNITTDINVTMDSRISVVSIENVPNVGNTVVLATQQAVLTGISGDDVNQLIWVQTGTGSLYSAVQVSSSLLANGFITLTVPATVNLETQPFFVVAAILPAFSPSSQLILSEEYVPYQGEGHAGRDYEIVYTEDSCLVTTNGTGAAPIPGLRDVYPYNRELPISTMLPAQPTWSDATLANTPVASYFDGNTEAKRFANVEHTFEVPSHTNDFIQPFSFDKRKTFQMLTPGGRGFTQATPHLGFAVTTPSSKTVLGATMSTTTAPVTLYVNNVTGNDNNAGTSLTAPFESIAAAIEALPPVLLHSCSIQLVNTGTPYSVSATATLQVVALGDGDVRPLSYYALGYLSFIVQQAGRLVISRLPTETGYIAINGANFSGFGDGPTSAFVVDNTRVLFNGLNFINFVDAAVAGIDADIEFVQCQWTTNQVAGSFSQGSSVIIDQGTLTVGNGNGFILSQSTMESSQLVLSVSPNTSPTSFYVIERGSSLSLTGHLPTAESGVLTTTLVAQAQLNSSIVVDQTFQSSGSLLLQQNSVLSRTVTLNPFLGGVVTDASSTISTAL